MKTAGEIGKQIEVDSREIRRICQRDNILPVFTKGRRKYYSLTQQEFIHKILYFARRCNVIVYESKMNKEEIQEPFEAFKKRNYGKRN